MDFYEYIVGLSNPGVDYCKHDDTYYSIKCDIVREAKQNHKCLLLSRYEMEQKGLSDYLYKEGFRCYHTRHDMFLITWE